MALSLEELNFQTLDLLDDGVAVKQCMKLIQQALADIKSRPGEKRPRKVMLQLNLTPKVLTEVDEDAGRIERILTGVGLEIKMDVRLPNRGTLTYDMGINGDRLVFNRNSPFDHRQPTLFDADDSRVINAKS